MGIPVAVYTAAKAIERGTFSCPRCKHWQRAEVVCTALGTASVLAGAESARSRAHLNASKEAVRTLRFATCPKCGKRSGHAAFIRPYALATLAITAIAFVFAYAGPVALKMDLDDDARALFHHWFPVLVLAIMAISVPAAIKRWRGNDRRVRWLEF